MIATGVEGRVDQRFDVEMLRAAQGGVCQSLTLIAVFVPSWLLIAEGMPKVRASGQLICLLQLDPQYRSLARDRSQAAGRKTRVMQVIDDPRNLLLRPMPVGYMKRKVSLTLLQTATAAGGCVDCKAACNPALSPAVLFYMMLNQDAIGQSMCTTLSGGHQGIACPARDDQRLLFNLDVCNDDGLLLR
jgi:hypothetical protein